MSTNYPLSAGHAAVVNVTAMAGIVRDMIAAGAHGPHDEAWLLHRATAAGLDRDERAALRALQERFTREGKSMLAGVTTTTWD